MNLTIVLICLEFDKDSLRTVESVPPEVSVIVKCCSVPSDISYAVGQFKNVQLVVSNDSGIYDAMNQALDYVQSEYVLYIGTNDFINSSEISELIPKLANGADAFIFGVALNGRVTRIEEFGGIRFLSPSRYSNEDGALSCIWWIQGI